MINIKDVKEGQMVSYKREEGIYFGTIVGKYERGSIIENKNPLLIEFTKRFPGCHSGVGAVTLDDKRFKKLDTEHRYYIYPNCPELELVQTEITEQISYEIY